jgi:hypothetical protein
MIQCPSNNENNVSAITPFSRIRDTYDNVVMTNLADQRNFVNTFQFLSCLWLIITSVIREEVPYDTDVIHTISRFLISVNRFLSLPGKGFSLCIYCRIARISWT